MSEAPGFSGGAVVCRPPGGVSFSPSNLETAVKTTKLSTNPAPYEGFSDLHCATERQFRSIWIVAGYERGELNLQSRRIGFRGMRGTIDCSEVTSVEWARKPFPWPIPLVAAALVVVLLYAKAPEQLAWNRPLPYLLAGILSINSLRQWRERWIEVGYRENGQLQRVYFRRDPVFGFSGRRNRKLYDEIRDKVLSGTPPPGT